MLRPWLRAQFAYDDRINFAEARQDMGKAEVTHTRGFVSIDSGQVHYRHVASTRGFPLVLLHGAPASSVALVPLLEALGASRPVYAPDCPGMGDSARLPGIVADAPPDLAALASAIWQAVDALGLDRVDLYGCLTGARIAVEMAVTAPGRVRRLVLDGISLLDDAERDDYLEHYIPRIAPDQIGSQFNATWHFCRDQYLFLPWYKKDAVHRRAIGLPPADHLHTKVVDVLKSIENLPAILRASLNYPVRERMSRLRVPTLAEAGLLEFLSDLSIMQTPMIEPLTASPERLAAKSAEIVEFLDVADQ